MPIWSCDTLDSYSISVTEMRTEPSIEITHKHFEQNTHLLKIVFHGGNAKEWISQKNHDPGSNKQHRTINQIGTHMYNTLDSTVHCDLELQLSSNKQTYSRVNNLLALLTVVKKTSKEIENVQSPFPGDDMKALETAVSAAIAVKS